MSKVVLRIHELKDMIIKSLVNAGVKPEHAVIIADSICEADLRGVTSHGIKMLPAYLEKIKKGGVELAEEPEIHAVSSEMYIVDGRGCFGQVAAYYGMKKIIDEVTNGKMCCAAVKNTNHCGMLAYYTEKIADEFAVGFMCCNTNPNVAAFGGAERVLGTNPFSVAFPSPDGNIVIDMATSAVAKGKIYEYEKKGENIPEGWVVDSEGKPAVDPKDALNGVMLPFAGHKGYAISLAIEILSGIISNSGYSKYVYSLHNVPDKIQNVGFFMLGFPIAPFMDKETYHERLSDFAEILKNSKRQQGSDRIVLPGEIEKEKKDKGMLNGLVVDEEIINLLRKGV